MQVRNTRNHLLQTYAPSLHFIIQVSLHGSEIKSAECECPRGNYKCSHAAALIIYGIHNLSRTDIECQCKKPTAPNQVKSVEEYGNFTGTLWLLSPEPEKSNVLPVITVEEIVLSAEFVNHVDKKSYLTEKLRMSEDQRIAVNKATPGQRDNPSWHMIRKGRLTASNFGSVLNCKRVTPSLIKRVLGQYDLSRVQAINWGIINENVSTKNKAMCRRIWDLA